jgi:hypothetical protein
MSFDFGKFLSRQSSIGQSRPSALNPLQWMTAILVGGLAFVRAPEWLIIELATLLGLNFALFAYAYLRFMHTKPEALRSEEHEYRMRALDQGVIDRSLVREKEIKAGRGIKVRNPKDIDDAVRRVKSDRPQLAEEESE